MQILVGHALGDAISPVIVGAIAGAVMGDYEKTFFVQWQGLQYGLFMTCFVTVMGGLFFLYTAMHIEQDRLLVDAEVHKLSREDSTAVSLAGGVSTSETVETLATNVSGNNEER